jgi:mono/diheme cytochrome c family protein
MPLTKHPAVFGLSVAFALALAGQHAIQAHRAVTSQYSYNEHVFPILRDHCGQCHVEGGAAPMSLLAYNDQSGGAFAWAQAIREVLVSDTMPPWFADQTGPAVEHPHTLTSRELDIVVTWASGGAPEGDPAKRPAPAAARANWAQGRPDLVVTMAAAHVVLRTPLETFDVTLPTNLSTARWIKSADLLPGSPTMVRRAWIRVVDGPVLRVWEPGDDVQTTPEGTAFQLPARARLQLTIFYKKPWQEEHDDKRDRSSIGLYFVEAPKSGNGIVGITVAGPKKPAAGSVTFTGTCRDRGVLAVRPQVDRRTRSMDIAAVTLGERCRS